MLQKRVPDVMDLLRETIAEQKELVKDDEKLPEGKIPTDNEILLSQVLIQRIMYNELMKYTIMHVTLKQFTFYKMND